MFAVPRRAAEPERAARVGQVRGAVDGALAIWRYRAGPERGGGPRPCVPGQRHGCRVRRQDGQRTGCVPRVRFRRDDVRQELRDAPVRTATAQAFRARNRVEPDDGTNQSRGPQRRGPARAALDRGPRGRR